MLLALLAPGFARLRIRIDGRALVPQDAPEVLSDRAIREEFGVGDSIVAVIETGDPDGIFNATTLAHVVAQTLAFEAIPGVEPGQVLSLATEPGDRVRPGSLEFPPWLEHLPSTPEEMDALRKGLSRARIYSGTLLSTDEPISATAVLLEVGEQWDRDVLHRQVLQSLVQVPGDRVLLVGAPVAETEFGTELMADLALLVPLAFLVMGAILHLFFRRLAIVALVLAGSGACIYATMALLGWSGAPVYLTCLVVPVFLTAVGVAQSIHLCDRWRRHRERGPEIGAEAALRSSLREIARPSIHAALTTALAFLSFALSPLPAVRVLGLAMTVGVLLSLLWSLVVLPAALALLGHRAVPEPGAFSLPLGRWIRPVLARPSLVWGLAALLAVAAGIGASRVRVQDSWVDGLSPENGVRRATARADEIFGGTGILRVRLDVDAVHARGEATIDALDDRSAILDGVLAEPPRRLVGHRFVVETGAVRPLAFLVTDASLEDGRTRLVLEGIDLPKGRVRTILPQETRRFSWQVDARGRWMQVAMLQELRRFEEFLAYRHDEDVGAVLGPWSELSTLVVMLGTSEERREDALSNRIGIGRALDFFVRGRGEARLREVLSPEQDAALVTALVRGANYVTVGKLIDDLRHYEREKLAPLGVRLAFGGDLAVSQAMIAGIVKTQALSIAFSLASVWIVAALLLRSVLAGLLCAVPCAFAVLCVYGTMGWLAIPLGVATSMFAGMAIGVGDDYAIHLWERFRERSRSGVPPKEAAAEAVQDVGPAVLVDALCVGAGFSVLLFSRVPTNARLGLLLVLAILGCAAATLHVLPVFLGRMRPRRDP